MDQKIYSTYIIYSQSLDIYYIGQTSDIRDRLRRHNTNRNKYTKNKGPWILLFQKDFESRSAAVSLERKLKAYKNKTYLGKWIEKHGGSEHPDL